MAPRVRKSTTAKAETIPRTEAPRSTGRLPVAISPKVVEGMAKVGGTNVEIAAYCQVSVDTLRRRFAALLAKSRAGRKLRLRKLQFQRAEKGSDTMLIWLGKQELGQRDVARSNQQEIEHKSPPRSLIEVRFFRPGPDGPVEVPGPLEEEDCPPIRAERDSLGLPGE